MRSKHRINQVFPHTNHSPIQHKTKKIKIAYKIYQKDVAYLNTISFLVGFFLFLFFSMKQ